MDIELCRSRAKGCL